MRREIFEVGRIGGGFLAIMAHPDFSDPANAPFEKITAHGVRALVSLLEAGEARSLGLYGEREIARSYGLAFTSYPIPDMGVPASVGQFARLATALAAQIDGGVNTLVHCRAGIGRSGLVAAGILMCTGLDAEAAMAQVSAGRGVRVPETPEQTDWLARVFAGHLRESARDRQP